MRITDVLRVEHRLLRALLEAMSGWLVAGTPPQALRERAVVVGVALEDHARREEQQLFEPLRARSEGARHLIGQMEIVHDEVRGLLEEIAAPSRDPKDRLWTIVQLTEEHFVKEEEEVFPLAEALLASDELLRLGAK
jgi:hemerythrin superfamily protein